MLSMLVSHAIVNVYGAAINKIGANRRTPTYLRTYILNMIS